MGAVTSKSQVNAGIFFCFNAACWHIDFCFLFQVLFMGGFFDYIEFIAF